MIPPSSKRPVWTAADAENTRAFLDSASGQRFLTRILYARPEYGPFKTIEERAVKSGEVDGYEKCILSVQSLRETDPTRSE